MKQALHQASNHLFLTSFHTLFLLTNVFTTATSLRVWPSTGWYVHDNNRNLPIRFQCLEERGVNVMWIFKGEDLSTSSPCINGATRTVCGPMLHISKFQNEYAGLYTCRNPSTRREVHVPLGVQPEFVDRHQTDYIAAEGERVELDCSVRPNIYPSASVVWQKREGGLLKEVYKGETHTIQKAGLEHSGTYLCKATNNPHKPLTTRLKHVVLNVYVPASCSFKSAKNVANNVSVAVEVSGTPQPGFSAAHPWHQLATDTSDHVVATRPVGFNESSRQLIGHLTQVVNSGRKTETLNKACNMYIDIPTWRLQMCVFIRFTPTAAFCAQNPSFNSQAKELVEQLVVNLYINHDGCHYNGDIRAVFVESDGQCQPFRIIAFIQSDVNSSFRCLSTSKINSWLSNWNPTSGKVEMFKNVRDQFVNLTHCNKLTPVISTLKCHRVFYCNKLPKKDRTVCLVNGYFRRVFNQSELNFERPFTSTENPRLLCKATLKESEVTVRT